MTMPKLSPSISISFLPVYSSYALRLLEKSKAQYSELSLYQSGELELSKSAVIDIMKSAENDMKMINEYQRQADRWKRSALNDSQKDGIIALDADLAQSRHINMNTFGLSIRLLKKCGYAHLPVSSPTIKLRR
jgi:hypothetical protein